jgi:uncharacterized membrane protein
MAENTAMELLALLIAGLILAFPIYVLTRLSELTARVRQLRDDVDALRAPRAAGGTAPPVPAKTQLARWRSRSRGGPPRHAACASSRAAPGDPASAARHSHQVPRRRHRVDIGGPRAPGPAPAAAPRPPAPPLTVPSRPARPSFSMDLEEVVGANWPAKLGIAAIAVAAAFFLKYAIDQGWIVPAARVAIGLAVAGAFYGLGQWLLGRPKYRRYAQALASGGVVIFFLTIWAAYSLYGLIGFSTAYGILAVAALAASALAVRNDTQAIGALCLLGAYATPVLIRQDGTGGSDLLRLYAYLLGVDLWAVLLVRFRPWYSLLAMAFGATWLVFFGAGHLQSANSWAVESFAALFLLFSSHSALKGMEMEPEGELAEGGSGCCLACSPLQWRAVVLADRFLIGIPALALGRHGAGARQLPAAIRGEAEISGRRATWRACSCPSCSG